MPDEPKRPDVNFLPIHKATFDPAKKTVSVHFTEQQLNDFEKSTIKREGRKPFEQRQLQNGWAQNSINEFLRLEGTRPLTLADNEHPLRFGGSALTVLEIESGPNQGKYWVGTARYTNRGWGRASERYTLSPDLAKFKNAGGVPSTLEEHLDPTIIGAKEGVEEIAFCRDQGDEVAVLCPHNLGNTGKDALNEAIERLNDAVSRTGNERSLMRTDETYRRFVLVESPSYVLTTFGPTYYALKIYNDGKLVKECTDVVLSWTPRYSALEVSRTLFRLCIPNQAALTGILTADGPDASLLRFAEDVYVAEIDRLCASAVDKPVETWQLNTTVFPNWPPTPTRRAVLYRPADGLQDLLDALIGKYDFTTSLRRVSSSWIARH